MPAFPCLGEKEGLGYCQSMLPSFRRHGRPLPVLATMGQPIRCTSHSPEGRHSGKIPLRILSKFALKWFYLAFNHRFKLSELYATSSPQIWESQRKGSNCWIYQLRVTNPVWHKVIKKPETTYFIVWKEGVILAFFVKIILFEDQSESSKLDNGKWHG